MNSPWVFLNAQWAFFNAPAELVSSRTSQKDKLVSTRDHVDEEAGEEGASARFEQASGMAVPNVPIPVDVFCVLALTLVAGPSNPGDS